MIPSAADVAAAERILATEPIVKIVRDEHLGEISQLQLYQRQWLAQLDKQLISVSGLNDLLLGLAPAPVAASSKAITALITRYEEGVKRNAR